MATARKNIVSRMLASACLTCLAVPALRRGFCAACEEDLPWQPPGCRLCGVALTAPWSLPDSGAPLCSRCCQQPPVFNSCHCTFAYEPPIAGMIRHFKDRAGFAEFRGLSNCFNEHFIQHYDDTTLPRPDLLLPVPLHTSRLRLRGFNQALLLAQRLSRRSGIAVLENSCRRRPGNTAQRGLRAAERRQNMPGMFTLHAATALTAGRHLAIIDDVVTTTATTQAMAAVMRSCNAARIDVWALARSNHQPET